MSKVTGGETGKRKADHIRINLEENVQFPRLTTGLEKLRFMHRALPELDLEQVDTRITVFKKSLAAPLLISSMTGGTDQAMALNRTLAEAAQTHRIAMGLGSQRAAIEEPALARTFQVRDIAPDILLFANLGAVQLNYGYTVDQCRKAVDMIEADALILHLNVLQEAVQAEGNTHWSGLLKKIEEVCKTVGVPVIAKEVGWGIAQDVAVDLTMAGVSAIDVAGSGGTSWSEVEYHRAPTSFHAQIARSFADWGIPTAQCLDEIRRTIPNMILFASGGLRDGIDVAKCVALGASLCGIAGPLLRAANESPEALDETLNIVTAQLRIAMMVSGVKDIDTLKETPLYPTQD